MPINSRTYLNLLRRVLPYSCSIITISSQNPKVFMPPFTQDLQVNIETDYGTHSKVLRTVLILRTKDNA